MMEPRALALWQKHVDRLPPLADYPITVRRFVAGEALATAGEPLTRLCFVVEGCATVHSMMENGRAVLLMEYRGVQCIGELELLTDTPTLTSDIRSITRGAMLCIPLENTREQILCDPAMLLHLAREVAKKLARTSRLASQDRLYPLAARLAAYLLYAQQGNRVTLHLTRLAEQMGTSYRHLLRTLREFADQQWLVREGSGYRVLDPQALAQLGKGIHYN